MTLAYKWLPIIFGCHCRSNRSFFYNGKKFPICARCTGELLGILSVPLLVWLFGVPSIIHCILLMIPMIIDGFLQLLTKYESNNCMRVITGTLFGFGLMSLFLVSTIAIANLGYAYGKK